MTAHATLERPGADAACRDGEARHRAGDLAGALECYDAVLALDPAHGHALHLSAMALYQLGEPGLAWVRIGRAIEALPDHAGVWSGQGLILAALGRPEEAAQAYERGWALAPDDGATGFNLGLVRRDLGRTQDAIAAFEAAAARGIDAAHHELGLTLQAAGRLDAALDAYRRALSVQPRADSALNAGAACHALGDWTEAEALFRQALELDPDCAKALNNLAVIAQDAGRAEEAAALCRRAIALDARYVDAWNNLGVAARRLGDADGALEAYRAALNIDALDPTALLNLTELLFDQGRGDDAVAHHRALADSRPDKAKAWLELGRALDRGDDLDGAVEALERAARRDSSLWTAPHRLGELHQRRGDPRAALDAHRRACALAPDQPDAFRMLALAALKVGDGELALTALATLVRLDPFDPRGWAYRALALRLTGGTAEADDLTGREDLVRVIPLGPPPGYASLDDFHETLTRDLAAVRLRVWSPRGQSVRDGFQTQNDLFAEPAASIQALMRHLDAAVAGLLSQAPAGIRAFIPTPPRARRYRSWSVRLAAGGLHAPHIHPEGCLSGVYYVQTPGGAEALDVGGLEFGRPGFALPLNQEPPTRVVQPRPGNLVLFPSYLWHGTQPFQSAGERITVAFDVLR